MNDCAPQASSRCETCNGSIDLMHIDPQRVIESTCPMFLGSAVLARRCAGSPHEVADWWSFCLCCESYWRFEVPEPSRRGQVADWVVSLAEGAHTLNETGERGKHTPDRFERPGNDCWPGTQ